jgi:Peptidase family M3
MQNVVSSPAVLLHNKHTSIADLHSTMLLMCSLWDVKGILCCALLHAMHVVDTSFGAAASLQQHLLGLMRWQGSVHQTDFDLTNSMSMHGDEVKAAQTSCQVDAAQPVRRLRVGCRFTHLVGYGGFYYSYAYAASLSDAIWEKHFRAQPLDKAAGMPATSFTLQQRFTSFHLLVSHAADHCAR